MDGVDGEDDVKGRGSVEMPVKEKFPKMRTPAEDAAPDAICCGGCSFVL